MQYYLIIEPDEDGNLAKIVDEKRFQEILLERANYPPLSFKEYREKPDSNYWDDEDWFACRVVPISIQPEEVVTKLQIIAEGE